MELKSNSWHAKLYRWNFGYYLPQSLCPYFWATILSIVTLVTSWYLYIPKNLREDINGWNKLFIGLMVDICFGVLLFLVKDGRPDYTWLEATGVLLLLVVAICTGIALLVGIIGAIIMAVEGIGVYLKKRKYAKLAKMEEQGIEPQPSMVQTWWKGFIGKYCPKIDWKN